MNRNVAASFSVTSPTDIVLIVVMYPVGLEVTAEFTSFVVVIGLFWKNFEVVPAGNVSGVVGVIMIQRVLQI